jgi:LmbE family N-acetylglucosaminyl deacetylase
VVSFDHRDAGTAEDDWLTSPRWQSVPALVLAEPRRLVVVAAHPDDESLGAGGLMARAEREGIPVRVIVATDGDASHPASPTTTAPQLAAIRRREVVEAVRRLAPTATVEFLHLPDGALREHVDALQASIRASTAGDGVLIVAPWRGDGHGDHEAAGQAASTVARETGAQLLEYPVWMWHWASPLDGAVPWSRFVTLELTEEELARKAEAIRCHVSQNAPLSDAPGDEVLLGERFHEYFQRTFEAFVTPLGSRTLTRDFFDDFYQGKEDPWGFETRWYEIRKRSLTLASLPRPLFASGLEVGCSIGVLTAELAGRCAQLIATDIAEQPLERARVRLIEQSHVRVTQANTPAEWPEGTFDLVVLSEVAYYWSKEDLQRVIARIDGCLTDDGVVVACHWRHPVDGYPERGDDVHAALRAFPGLSLLSEHREEDFLLDVLVRPEALSVAGETGLL